MFEWRPKAPPFEESELSGLAVTEMKLAPHFVLMVDAAEARMVLLSVVVLEDQVP